MGRLNRLFQFIISSIICIRSRPRTPNAIEEAPLPLNARARPKYHQEKFELLSGVGCRISVTRLIYPISTAFILRYRIEGAACWPYSYLRGGTTLPPTHPRVCRVAPTILI